MIERIALVFYVVWRAALVILALTGWVLGMLVGTLVGGVVAGFAKGYKG
jgi:hypothetical protein